MLPICDSYLIDRRTLAVENFFDGVHKTKITTKDGVFYSKKSATNLLDKACKFYASTMQGRVNATRETMKFHHKTPFIIIPLLVGVFPTTSPENINCVWIFNHPFEVEELSKGKSRVKFRSGESIIVSVSKYILEKQQLRLHTSLSTYKEMNETPRYSLWLEKRKLVSKRKIYKLVRKLKE